MTQPFFALAAASITAARRAPKATGQGLRCHYSRWLSLVHEALDMSGFESFAAGQHDMHLSALPEPTESIFLPAEPSRLGGVANHTRSMLDVHTRILLGQTATHDPRNRQTVVS